MKLQWIPSMISTAHKSPSRVPQWGSDRKGSWPDRGTPDLIELNSRHTAGVSCPRQVMLKRGKAKTSFSQGTAQGRNQVGPKQRHKWQRHWIKEHAWQCNFDLKWSQLSGRYFRCLRKGYMKHGSNTSNSSFQSAGMPAYLKATVENHVSFSIGLPCLLAASKWHKPNGW